MTKHLKILGHRMTKIFSVLLVTSICYGDIITLKNNKLQCVEQNTKSNKTSIENEDSD